MKRARRGKVKKGDIIGLPSLRTLSLRPRTCTPLQCEISAILHAIPSSSFPSSRTQHYGYNPPPRRFWSLFYIGLPSGTTPRHMGLCICISITPISEKNRPYPFPQRPTQRPIYRRSDRMATRPCDDVFLRTFLVWFLTRPFFPI
jgi:hypothetical protein